MYRAKACTLSNSPSEEPSHSQPSPLHRQMAESFDRQETWPLDGSKAIATEDRVCACYNGHLDQRGPTENLQSGFGRRLAKNGLAAR